MDALPIGVQPEPFIATHNEVDVGTDGSTRFASAATCYLRRTPPKPGCCVSLIHACRPCP